MTSTTTGHSTSDLATATKTDPELLKRILRLLAAYGALRQVAPGTYAATSLSEILARNETDAATMGFLVDLSAPMLLRTPAFLKSIGYTNPADVMNCPFQSAFDTKESFFEWLHAHPDAAATFNKTMSGYNSQRPNWFQFFPVEQSLLSGALPGQTILVDIGGGHGHDISRFAQRFPQTAGQLVLQDLPPVIEGARADPGVKATSHDFFTPQPIKGARAYYMHSVLHDWPDAQALEILTRTKEAMDGQSRLLLNEQVIAAVDPKPLAVANDLTIMAYVAGKERDEELWQRLLAEAGLEIVEIWSVPGAAESLIEAKRVI